MPRYSVYCLGGELLDACFDLRSAFLVARERSFGRSILVRDEDTGRYVMVKEGRVL